MESDGIPGGELKMLLTPALISMTKPSPPTSSRMPIQPKVREYDHAFLLDAEGDASQPAAQGVWSQDGKLRMTVYTSAPALQFTPATISAAPRRRRRGALRRLAGTGAGSEIPAGFARPSAMAPGRTVAAVRASRQPDGISVYRPIIANPPSGALLSSPALLSAAASFFSNLLYFPSPKDKKITCVLQAPYTAPLFSLWLGISIAVRQITAI